MAEYLPEDQDLLDELAGIGDMSTGSALSENQRKISAIHIKATLRSRKTAVDVDRSTARFSIILAAFAMIQIVIALCQLLYAFVSDIYAWQAFGVALVLLVAVVVIMKGMDPEKILSKREKE